MSVFTHGVDSKDKPRMIDRNQVFPVAQTNKSLRFMAHPGNSQYASFLISEFDRIPRVFVHRHLTFGFSVTCALAGKFLPTLPTPLYCGILSALPTLSTWVAVLFSCKL